MFSPQFFFVRGAPSRKRKVVIVSEMEHKFCIVLYHKQVGEDGHGILYYSQLPSYTKGIYDRLALFNRSGQRLL